MLHKLRFAPGINREGTQYSAEAGWWDCDKIRFRKGRPEQIGGWEKYMVASYLGVCRSIHDWSTATANNYLGLGTNLKFYVENGGTLADITPLRETTAAGDVTFSAINGSATLTIADTSHGAVIGDYVTFVDAVSLGGNISAVILNQEYEIATLINADSYTVEAKDNTLGTPILANASDTGNGGASAFAEYQINTGTNAYIPSVGYGVGVWGSSAWGGGGALLFSGQLRLYSQDTFGDDLVFCPRAGGIYFWDESVGTSSRAVELSEIAGALEAPTAALQVMVSPVDKHVIAFGVNPIGLTAIDPLFVRWSDQESINDWKPSVTNSSGGRLLSSGTKIIGAIRTRHEIVIFTDTSVHAMRFSGAPYVYQFAPVGENVSIVSPNAMIAAGDAVYFMDSEGFYLYRGSVQRLPCSVLEYVFSNVDKVNLFKVYATNNPDDSEVTWFYPTVGSDITNYVTYNYMEEVWTIGTLERGAWIQAMSRTYPIASSADIVTPKVNYLYNQEIGFDAEGEEMGAYIESGQREIATQELGDGESLMFIDRMIADFKVSGIQNNALFNVIIKGTDYPQIAPTERYSSPVAYDTGQSDIRVRAREIVLRIEPSGTGYGWSMGDFRFDMRTDGKR